MAYGLKIWDANGNVRLDTTDRQFRYVAYYSGTVPNNSTVTINVSGMTNNGTWGLNETNGSNLALKISMGSNQFTLTNTAGLGAAPYKVQVFQI